MDITKTGIIIRIGTKIYAFKSSYKIVEFFSNEENTRDIEGFTDEMKYILTRPHIIQRILKLKKGELQTHLIKQTTRDKYLNIPNFQMMKA